MASDSAAFMLQDEAFAAKKPASMRRCVAAMLPHVVPPYRLFRTEPYVR
jgi:hypothetical protein